MTSTDTAQPAQPQNTQEVTIYLVAAMDLNRAIGRTNQLPWTMPSDMRRFKNLTMGHPVIMGRNTYESMGHCLPGRINLAVTGNPNNIKNREPQLLIFESIELAIQQAKRIDNQIFIIGGQKIYEQAIHLADIAYLTIVHTRVPDADAWFPRFDQCWKQIASIPLGKLDPTKFAADQFSSSMEIWFRT